MPQHSKTINNNNIAHYNIHLWIESQPVDETNERIFYSRKKNQNQSKWVRLFATMEEHKSVNKDSEMLLQKSDNPHPWTTATEASIRNGRGATLAVYPAY